MTARNHGLCPDTGQVVLHLDDAIRAEILVDPVCDPEDFIDLRISTAPTNIVTVSAPGYFQIGDFHQALDTGKYDIAILNQIGCRLDTVVQLSTPGLVEMQVDSDYVEVPLGESVQFIQPDVSE